MASHAQPLSRRNASASVPATSPVTKITRFAAAGVACAALQVQRFAAGIFRAFEDFRPENVGRVLQGVVYTLMLAVLLSQNEVPGKSAAGQGLTTQTWDQSHSAARPIVPMPTPASAPKVIGRSAAGSLRR